MAEEKIKDLAKILSENPNPVFRISGEGVILYANKSSSDVLETWGCGVGECMPEPCLGRAKEVFELGEVFTFEFTCKNGRIFSVTLAPVKESGYLNVYGYDVTARKHIEREHEIAEEAVRRSEELYHNLYNTAPLAIAVWDSECRITDWNKRAEEMFGWSKDEVIGKNFFSFLIPEDEQPHVDSVVRSLLLGRLPSHTENANLAKNGKRIVCEWNNAILRDADGQVVGAISMGLDVTDRKKAEDDLLRYRENLEELVDERTAELGKTNERLMEENERRQVLERELLNVSERERRRIGRELHDSLGQQLTGISFMIKMLEGKLKRKSIEESSGLARVGDLIREATEHARQLAKGLHPVDLKAGTLMPCLGELALRTERLFGISCNLIYDGAVEVDSTEATVHIYRIAQEAITNAIKHGRTKNILIEAVYGEDEHKLIVENDGLDFPKEFEKKGTGMGLQIMDHRADIIGGYIDIRKGENGGTRLKCTFPNTKNKHL